MLGRLALVFTLFALGLSLDVQAANDAVRPRVNAAKKAQKFVVKKVRRKDGSVMVRLDLPVNQIQRVSATAGNPADATAPAPANPDRAGSQAKDTQVMSQWLDAVTEPRFMTALATVALEPGSDAHVLNQGIDPAKVRNWAEFVDPDLYLRWKTGNLDPRVNRAILRHTPELQALPIWIGFALALDVPAEARSGTPLKPNIWSRAFGDGPGGREAAQEWLTLPMAEPGMNPWLRANQGYRY